MTIEELLNDIRANRGDFFASTLARWLEKNAAFRLFIEGYKDKVRKKLNDCDNENKRRDLLWELEVAYLLSKSNDFGLEYERYGKNIARSPDYTVSQRLEVQFDAEATRIRKTQAEAGLSEWETDIKAAIRAIPSDCGVSLSITADFTRDLLARLRAARDDIKRFLAEKIASTRIAPDRIEQYAVPGFEDEVEILITKSALKFDRNHTSYYGSDLPVAYSNREFTKFGDIICDKICQLRDGTANILMIGSDTDVHEFRDCIEAIENLLRRAAEKDEEFFRKHRFAGTDDFLAQFPKLSGILFRNRWQSENADRNAIWCNPHAAHPLPGEIWDYLRAMD